MNEKVWIVLWDQSALQDGDGWDAQAYTSSEAALRDFPEAADPRADYCFLVESSVQS